MNRDNGRSHPRPARTGPRRVPASRGTGGGAPRRLASPTVSEWPGVLDTRALDQSLHLNLRLAAVVCSRRMEAALRDRGLSAVELVTLALIQANPGIRQGVLASTLQLKPAYMTKLVQSLQDLRLVKRTVPANDRRSVELRLSSEGEAVTTAERERVEAFETRMHAGLLSPAEQRQLLKLLKKVWQADDPDDFEILRVI